MKLHFWPCEWELPSQGIAGAEHALALFACSCTRVAKATNYFFVMDGDLFPIQYLKQRQCGDWPFIFGQITPKSAGNLFQRLFVRLPASGLAGHTGNLSKPDSYPSSWAQNDAFQPLHFLFLIKVRNRPFFRPEKLLSLPAENGYFHLWESRSVRILSFKSFPLSAADQKTAF